VSEEQIKRRGGDDRLDDDLPGAEPIELLTAVEQNLQGADPKAERAEAEPVQLLIGVARGVCSVMFRPRAFAAFNLRLVRYLIGAWTGRSAWFLPRKMPST